MPRRAVLAGLGALFIAAWATSSLLLKTTPSDLDVYFWPAAQSMVAGHPFSIYASGLHGAYPNANGPLGLVPLVPVAAFANVLGLAGNLGPRAALVGAMVSLFVLLLAYQSVDLIRAGRGPIRRPLAVACVILLAPALWIAVIDFGHVEQPLELCLVLLAVRCVRNEHAARAGIALGAAILARTIAGFCMIPIALLPIATRRVRPALTAVLAGVAACVIGLVPFILGDAPALVHSLLTYRGSLPIGGGSFLVLARDTGWGGFVQHIDVDVAALVAAVISAIVLMRRPGVATTAGGLLGLLTIASACFPLFAKTVFAYYMLEPYVFSALWWLARPGSARNWRVLAPVLLTANVLLAELGQKLLQGGWSATEGVTSSVVIAIVIGLVAGDLLHGLPPGRKDGTLEQPITQGPTSDAYRRYP